MNIIILLFNFLLIFLFGSYEVDTIVPGYSSRRCAPIRISKGKMRLRSNGRLAKVVCFAGYQTLGDKFVFCEEGVWRDPIPSCIKSGCPSMKILVPNSLITESYAGALVKVTCADGYSLFGASVFSCNGVNWNDTIPSCYVDKEKIQKSCDFESSDMCGWTNDKMDNFDWKIHNGATPSGHAGTGPEFDHTQGSNLNGNYLFIEASNRNLGDVARLISQPYPPVDQNETACFTFWYHMYGGHIGSLNVYVGQDLSFSETGNHGNRWIKAVVPINQTSPFHITIEGVRGNGYAGDIAIDDLKISEGSQCLNQKNESEVILGGSCLGRCNDNTTTDIDSCYCHEKCHENNTCCADFLQICGLGNQASYYREDKRMITPSAVVGIILAVLITLTLGVVVGKIVFVIRRRRINSNGNNCDDDSDVQFLTSDEILNFNWARPSPDREETPNAPKSKPPRQQKAVPQDCIRLVDQ